MLQAEIDEPRNLLKVAYSGRVGPDETNRAAVQLEQLLKKVKPGFRLLTNLSGLEAMELACVPHLKRMMDLCDQEGVQLVIRVIPDPHKDIGLNILSLFHYHRHIRIITCQTLEAALKILDA
jgi:anti-anti-sigma regulatory factor